MTDPAARALLKRLGAFLDQFAGCFGRRVQRAYASRYVQGLLNDSERKSMQPMHGRLSDPGDYQGLQHFITHSTWEVRPFWRRLREGLPIRRGILAVDDTAFPKQGKASVGVQRQYCGALGKIGNCQVAVSTALIADGLAWPTSLELYLPQDWIDDDARRTAARIPAPVSFREKWRIALAHVRTVQQAGVTIEAVVADTAYGQVAAFRTGLERLGLRYVLAVPYYLSARVAAGLPGESVAAIANGLAPSAWHRVRWATGTKGPLVARFAAIRVRPAKSRAERWLLCEESLTDGERRVLLQQRGPRDPAADVGGAGAQPMGDRGAVPRLQDRTRVGSFRRAQLSRLEPSRRPCRHDLPVSPTGASASDRSAADVSRGAQPPARSHGRLVVHRTPTMVKTRDQFSAESAAANLTK